MSEVIVPFSPGWIKRKDELKHSAEFTAIINFYMFSTPCEYTSSSGQSMRNRNWGNDIWKSQELRLYLLSKADLNTGITLAKTKKLDEMSKCISSIGLSGAFHKLRDRNRIAFYSDGKHVDILAIFYYIRCAFAHGRFEIYKSETGDRVYVLESIDRKRGTTDFFVKARLVLNESILLIWSDIIKFGKADFSDTIGTLENSIKDEILRIISDNKQLTKQQIVEKIKADTSFTQKQFKALTVNGKIRYDSKKKMWQCQ
ncbi:MAG: hypothetical protein ACYCYM_08035 [Saccharofermentanales bacterium]